MQRVTAPSKEVVQFRKDDLFKITIEKTKGQKRTSPVANFSPGQKVEKKRSTTDNSELGQNWGNFFRQQTLLYMTKKPCTCQNDERETKKNINAKNQQKSTVKHPVSIINCVHLNSHLYEYILLFLFLIFNMLLNILFHT